jgi:hypothetical protein
MLHCYCEYLIWIYVIKYFFKLLNCEIAIVCYCYCVYLVWKCICQKIFLKLLNCEIAIVCYCVYLVWKYTCQKYFLKLLNYGIRDSQRYNRQIVFFLFWSRSICWFRQAEQMCKYSIKKIPLLGSYVRHT